MQFIDVAKAMDSDLSGLVVLKQTKHITDQDLADPRWVYLRKLYDANQDSSTAIRTLITIANAALYQDRRHYVKTRDGIRSMVRADKNWKKSRSFKAEHWDRILWLGYGKDGVGGLFKKGPQFKVGETTRTLYSLTDPTLLGFLSHVDDLTQFDTAHKFIGTIEKTLESKGDGAGDGSGDGQGDLVLSTLETKSPDNQSPVSSVPSFTSEATGSQNKPILADEVTESVGTIESSTKDTQPTLPEWDELCGRAFALSRAAPDTYEIAWGVVMDAFLPDDGEALQWSFPNPEMPPELITFAVNEFRICMGDDFSFSPLDVAKGLAKAIKPSSRVAVSVPPPSVPKSFVYVSEPVSDAL